MVHLRDFMIAIGMTASWVFANLNWESFAGYKPTQPSIFVGVGDSIWIGNPERLIAVDTAFKNPRSVQLPFESLPTELKWEMGILRALVGETWWKSADRGRTWQPCERDCLPVQSAVKYNSAYLRAGRPILPIQTDWHGPSILPTSKGRLHSVPGAIFRKGGQPDTPQWQMVATGWRDDLTLSLHRVAKGILAMPERQFRDSGEFLVPIARPAFLSKDEGDSWQEISPEEDHCITAVQSQGKWICQMDSEPPSLAQDSLLISGDSGLTWVPLFIHPNPSNPIVAVKTAFLFEDAWALSAEIQDKVHLFFSNDQGVTWREGTPNVAENLHLTSLLFRVQSQWALFTEAGLFVSANSGQTWTLKALPPQLPEQHMYHALASINQLWYTRENGDIFVSNDVGNTWLSYKLINKLLGISNGILIGERSDSLLISADQGKTWETPNPPTWASHNKRYWQGALLLPTSMGLYSSTDSGKSWRFMSEGRVAGLRSSIHDLDVKGDSLLVASDSGVYLIKKTETGFSSGSRIFPIASAEPYRVLLGDGLAIAYSASQLLYFHQETLKTTALQPNPTRQFTLSANHVYVSESGLMFILDQKEAILKAIPLPLEFNRALPEGIHRQLAVQNGIIYCLTSNGLFQSSDTGETWNLARAPILLPTPRMGTLRRGLNGLVLQAGISIWHRSDHATDWNEITAKNERGSFETRHLSDSMMVICSPTQMPIQTQTAPYCLIRLETQSDWSVLETLPGYLVTGKGSNLFAVSGNNLMIRGGSQGQWRELTKANCSYIERAWTIHEIGRRLIAREVCASGPNRILISNDLGQTWRTQQTTDTLPDFSHLLEAPPFYYRKNGDRYWLSDDEFTYEAPNMGALSLVRMGNHLVFSTQYNINRTEFPNPSNSLATMEMRNRKANTRNRMRQGIYSIELKDKGPTRLILVNGKAVKNP